MAGSGVATGCRRRRASSEWSFPRGPNLSRHRVGGRTARPERDCRIGTMVDQHCRTGIRSRFNRNSPFFSPTARSDQRHRAAPTARLRSLGRSLPGPRPRQSAGARTHRGVRGCGVQGLKTLPVADSAEDGNGGRHTGPAVARCAAWAWRLRPPLQEQSSSRAVAEGSMLRASFRDRT